MYAQTLRDGKERGAVLYWGANGSIVVGPTVVGTDGSTSSSGVASVPSLGNLPRNAIGTIHTHPHPNDGIVGPSGGDVNHARGNVIVAIMRDEAGIWILNENGEPAGRRSLPRPAQVAQPSNP